SIPSTRFQPLRRRQPDAAPTEKADQEKPMTPTTPTIEEAIRHEVSAEVTAPASLPPNIFEAPGPVKLQRRLTLLIPLTPFVGFLVGMRLLWGGIPGLALALLARRHTSPLPGATVGPP